MGMMADGGKRKCAVRCSNGSKKRRCALYFTAFGLRAGIAQKQKVQRISAGLFALFFAFEDSLNATVGEINSSEPQRWVR
jgi:hypothetical protein